MNFLSINVIDVIIILMILLAGVVGLKRGVFKELVMTVGYFILVLVSFWIKTPLGEFLAENLPFLTFGKKLIYMPVVNIIFYQMIAFLLVFAVLAIIFNVILFTTKVLETILNATIILGLISKICGFIVGLIEGYIIMYFVCVLLSFPIFNQSNFKIKLITLNIIPTIIVTIKTVPILLKSNFVVLPNNAHIPNIAAAAKNTVTIELI